MVRRAPLWSGGHIAERTMILRLGRTVVYALAKQLNKEWDQKAIRRQSKLLRRQKASAWQPMISPMQCRMPAEQSEYCSVLIEPMRNPNPHKYRETRYRSALS